MSAPEKPAGWTVLGSGPLADAIRSKIAEDPDRYRPVTISMNAVGTCPCCRRRVYRVTSRHTGWVAGFSADPDDPKATHPSFNAQTKKPEEGGTLAGCCCVAPNWGPEHAKKKRRRR